MQAELQYKLCTVRFEHPHSSKLKLQTKGLVVEEFYYYYYFLKFKPCFRLEKIGKEPGFEQNKLLVSFNY